MPRKNRISTLETRTSNVSGTIHLGGMEEYEIVEVLSEFEKFCRHLTTRWAYIRHDLDTFDDGTKKEVHIHFLFDLVTRLRLGTLVYKLADWLAIDTLAISVEKYSSWLSCFQYFVHRNDWEKVQYAPYLIKASFSFDEIKAELHQDNDEFTFDQLFDVIANARNRTEIVARLGISFYRKYYFVIRDIFNDTHVNMNVLFKRDYKGDNKNA